MSIDLGLSARDPSALPDMWLVNEKRKNILFPLGKGLGNRGSPS
jgi:hypothetical protein